MRQQFLCFSPCLVGNLSELTQRYQGEIPKLRKSIPTTWTSGNTEKEGAFPLYSSPKFGWVTQHPCCLVLLHRGTSLFSVDSSYGRQGREKLPYSIYIPDKTDPQAVRLFSRVPFCFLPPNLQHLCVCPRSPSVLLSTGNVTDVSVVSRGLFPQSPSWFILRLTPVAFPFLL